MRGCGSFKGKVCRNLKVKAENSLAQGWRTGGRIVLGMLGQDGGGWVDRNIGRDGGAFCCGGFN
jgi:hypothetical protein